MLIIILANLQFLLRYIMQQGIRRGLHVDDDEGGQKYEYGGFDAGRKKGSTQKGLDDLLFGGGPRKPRRPAPAPEKKQQPAQNTSTEKAKPEPPAKQPDANRSSGTVAPTGPSYSINQSRGAQYADLNRSEAQVGGRKQPSIIKTAEDDSKSKEPGGTIGIISKPQIDNYVKPSNPQPSQAIEQVIQVQPIQGYGKINKHNKPGFLRKGKKVAENFKFAEENVTKHSAVDVVRPFETDRARQRKLNDFNFHDFEFPAKSISLGGAWKDKQSVWKQPKEVAKVVNFGKYIDPNDLNPGSLSGPEFLSALSGISELEANTKRLIEDQQVNSNGFYLVRLFVNSVWRYVAVDSSIPFIDGEHAGVISYQGDFDLQNALIEKAYAKSFGGYDVFEKVQPREYYLRDLTGSPVRRYTPDHPDLKNIVSKALSSGQVVQAVPNEKIAALGINPHYSYSVINFSNKGIELRNSWGTLEERSKASIRSEGNFELSSGQIKENISYIVVTNINNEYSTTTVQSRHRLGFYSTYNFKVRNNAHGFLTVSQWDSRLFPSASNYSYSPATIILQRNNEDGSVEYINANHSINGRNLDLEVNLTPGNYTVFSAINWVGEDHSFNLTFYGSEKIDFSRVYTDKEPSAVSQGLESFNVDNGKRTDLSKTAAQYFSYHRESNCIIITVENTSNREGRTSIDLSRAKFDSVTLISGHNNEENYSEKVSYQIDDYKQASLSDKRWAAYLEPGSRFTWVLAVKQAFNESNARAWGFN